MRKKKEIPPKKKAFYKTNDLARNWLLGDGYTNIWLKRHDTRHPDSVWLKREPLSTGKMYVVRYKAVDLWNLFDGMCFDDEGTLTFLQIKTDAWPNRIQITNFIEDKQGFNVLAINVKTRIKNGPKVETKSWMS